ncbi:hypothetical protein GGR51DRAFT_568777 [Nemania sp. FL0031]|nr:hypothetical protein GGR51DRAFT_568777 [Nemania sp. FL0031]
MQALRQYSHLDVRIFEAAAAFKKAGLAVGITRNAQAALNLIGQPPSQLLARAGTVPMKDVRFMIAEGEGAGQVINKVDNSQGTRLTSIIHRAAYLQQLLADVPKHRLHSSKKLEGIRHESDSVTLQFADGIHGTVRKLPYNKARASLWEGLINSNDVHKYSWARNGTYILHNVLNDGQLVQFVIGSSDDEPPDQWGRAISADPEQNSIYLWDHPPARTYASGPLCVMGDAAHVTTPCHGSGGGMSIEDKLLLSTLLRRTKMGSALKVYDRVRRSRTQRIVESSRVTRMMLIGKALFLRWRHGIYISCHFATSMFSLQRATFPKRANSKAYLTWRF